MTLTEFLAARLDDDEQEARGFSSLGPDARRRGCEVKAKRKILALHEQVPRDLPPDVTYSCLMCYTRRTCDTLRAVAAIYSDHPDYDPDWAIR